MYGSNSGYKLKTAAKVVSIVTASASALLFIVSLFAQHATKIDYGYGNAVGGITASFLVAAIIQFGILLFVAWLSYHVLNALGDAAVSAQATANAMERLLSMTAICKSCGSSYGKNLPACPHCGIKNATQPLTEVSADSWKCKQCSSLNPSSSIQCKNCAAYK